jgi:hypothetical protein
VPRIFYTEKIQRLRPGSNPRTRELEVGTQTTRLPKPSPHRLTNNILYTVSTHKPNLQNKMPLPTQSINIKYHHCTSVFFLNYEPCKRSEYNIPPGWVQPEYKVRPPPPHERGTEKQESQYNQALGHFLLNSDSSGTLNCCLFPISV